MFCSGWLPRSQCESVRSVTELQSRPRAPAARMRRLHGSDTGAPFRTASGICGKNTLGFLPLTRRIALFVHLPPCFMPPFECADAAAEHVVVTDVMNNLHKDPDPQQFCVVVHDQSTEFITMPPALYEGPLCAIGWRTEYVAGHVARSESDGDAVADEESVTPTLCAGSGSASLGSTRLEAAAAGSREELASTDNTLNPFPKSKSVEATAKDAMLEMD